MYVYKPHYLLGLPFCCGPFTEGVPIIELECYHTDNNTIAFLNLYQLSVAVLAPPIVTSQYLLFRAEGVSNCGTDGEGCVCSTVDGRDETTVNSNYYTLC